MNIVHGAQNLNGFNRIFPGISVRNFFHFISFIMFITVTHKVWWKILLNQLLNHYVLKNWLSCHKSTRKLNSNWNTKIPDVPTFPIEEKLGLSEFIMANMYFPVSSKVYLSLVKWMGNADLGASTGTPLPAQFLFYFHEVFIENWPNDSCWRSRLRNLRSANWSGFFENLTCFRFRMDLGKYGKRKFPPLPRQKVRLQWRSKFLSSGRSPMFCR